MLFFFFPVHNESGVSVAAPSQGLPGAGERFVLEVGPSAQVLNQMTWEAAGLDGPDPLTRWQKLLERDLLIDAETRRFSEQRGLGF